MGYCCWKGSEINVISTRNRTMNTLYMSMTTTRVPLIGSNKEILSFAIHELASRAKEIYLSPKAQTEDRRLLLSYAFSNLTLSQGKLEVKYTPAFEFLSKWVPTLNKDFEPQKTVDNKEQKTTSVASCPTLLHILDEFRTLNWRIFQKELQYIQLTLPGLVDN